MIYNTTGALTAVVLPTYVVTKKALVHGPLLIHTIAVEAKRTVKLQTTVGAETRSVNLENNLFLTDLRTNLL